MSKQSPNTDFDTSFVLWDCSTLFFYTPGREARDDCFETFCGFRAQRALGLLYVAVPIAT